MLLRSLIAADRLNNLICLVLYCFVHGLIWCKLASNYFGTKYWMKVCFGKDGGTIGATYDTFVYSSVFGSRIKFPNDELHHDWAIGTKEQNVMLYFDRENICTPSPFLFLSPQVNKLHFSFCTFFCCFILVWDFHFLNINIGPDGNY